MASVNEIISKKAIDDILVANKNILTANKSLLAYIKTIESQNKTLNQSKQSIQTVSKARATSKKTVSEAAKVQKQYSTAVQKVKIVEGNYSIALEKQKKILTEKKKLVKDNIILNDKQAGTIEKLTASNRRLREAKTKLNLETKKGQKDLKTINAELDKNNKKIIGSGDAAQKQSANVGNYGSAMTGLLGPIRLVNGALTMLLANPVVAIFAAIVVVFTLLVKAMKRSEEGQDRLNKVMAVASSVFDNVMDILTVIGIALFDTLPAILKVAGNKFQIFALNMKAGFKSAQLALAGFLGQDEKVARLTGELDTINGKVGELKAESKKLTDEISEGFSEAGLKIKNFGKEVTEDIQRAIALAKLIADTNKLERKAITENAKIAKESAKLRGDAELLKRIDAIESIRLMEKSFSLDEKILANELKLAQNRAQIARETSALAVDDIEFKKEIAEAEAEVFAVETRFNDLRTGRIRKLNMLKKQAFKQDQERAKALIEVERFNAEALLSINESIIENESQSLEDRKQAVIDNQKILRDLAEKEFQLELAALKFENEIGLKNKEAYDAELLALNAKRNSERTQAEQEAFDELLELTQEYQDARVDADRADGERELEMKILRAEATIENEEVLQNTIRNLQRMALEQRIAEIDLLIEKEEEGSLRRIELEQERADAMLDLKRNETEAEISLEELKTKAKEAGLTALAGIFGKQNILQKGMFVKEKALAIKSILINLAKEKAAIAFAYAAIPFVGPAIAAGLIAKANLRAILGIGLVAAQTVAGFKKGTKGKHNTPDVFDTSEDGKTEWIERAGNIIQTDKPTRFTGMSGSRVYSNPEVENIIGHRKRSGSFSDIGIVNAINNSAKETNKSISNIKTYIIDKEGNDLGFTRGGFTKRFF